MVGEGDPWFSFSAGAYVCPKEGVVVVGRGGAVSFYIPGLVTYLSGREDGTSPALA